MTKIGPPGASQKLGPFFYAEKLREEREEENRKRKERRRRKRRSGGCSWPVDLYPKKGKRIGSHTLTLAETLLRQGRSPHEFVYFQIGRDERSQTILSVKFEEPVLNYFRNSKTAKNHTFCFFYRTPYNAICRARPRLSRAQGARSIHNM